MRAILVPVADRPECAIALLTAFDMASRLSANVAGYHVRPHRTEARRKGRTAPFVLRATSDWQKLVSDDDVRLDRQAAKAFFERQVEQSGFVLSKSARYREEGGLAMWHEMTGSPEHVFSIIGPLADLMVVSRPKRKSSARARSFMLSALMCTGRPVLLLPQYKLPQLGTRVLIAWNQSVEAAAAVSAALPLLRVAEQVTIMTAGAESRVGPKSTHLKQYLKLWNVHATIQRTPGKFAQEELTDCYQKNRANLLVMGAYSRGQWRETVFGGMTDHILNHTSLPTLLLHR